MSLLEVCINADNIEHLSQNIATAIEHGAERFELCGEMQHEGLTPSAQAIELAKQQTAGKAHLAVMIRPRAGDFNYDASEIAQMVKDIDMAACLGADSMVFGITANEQLAKEDILTLVSRCKAQGVQYVFHRAFDTLDRPVEGLVWLAEQGFSRILTAGTRWGSDSTLEQGLDNIKFWLAQTATDVEIIIGGGLNQSNIAHVLTTMAPVKHKVSLHTHSAVLDKGLVSGELIDNFVSKIKQQN